jgi:serine/threonine protein kinase/tetratricopeptide (TPR) repeat protein/DNA-binding MarR family transcriptional regulator
MSAPISGPAPCQVDSDTDTGLLGLGASARVFRARLTEPLADLEAGTPVALKQVHGSQDQEGREALTREIALLGEIEHEGLLPVLAHGESAEGLWLILPLLEGPTLKETVAGGGLPEAQLRELGLDLARALAALHALGHVHGDLKPENVRFDLKGRAYLLDLGFAAPTGCAFSERGTPGYLPPEYLAGAKWDPSGDIFALGVTLYQAATGEHPCPAALELGAESAIIKAFSRRDARRPSLLAASLSPAMDQWLAAALDPDAAGRPSTEQSEACFQSPKPWVGENRNVRSNPWSAAIRLPLVGRETELTEFLSHWHAVRSDNKPRLLWVCAPTGGGSSRLMSEAARRARLEDPYPTVLSGRIGTFQEERPGHVLRGLVRQWLSLPRHAEPRTVDVERINKLLPPREADALIAVLSPAQEDSPVLAEPQVLIAFLQHLAMRAPLWIQLDDANFGGRSTLETLERLVHLVKDLPVLLVVAAHSDLENRSDQAFQSLCSAWESHAHCERLNLGPLSREAMLQFVRSAFIDDTPHRALAKQFYHHTEGHPGRLRELLWSMEAQGHLHESSRRLELKIKPSDIPLPRSQTATLSARYSRLNKWQRIWLVRFAIAGSHMTAPLLAEAFDVTPQSVESHIAQLVRGGWLERAGSGTRFRRHQVRRALVKAIPEARARRLHLALATALDQSRGSVDAKKTPFSMGPAFEEAWHLKCAGKNETLVKRLPHLIRALQRSGHPSRLLLLAEWGLSAQTKLKERSGLSDKQTFAFLILGAQAAHQLGQRKKEAALLDQLTDLPLDAHEDAKRLGLVQLLIGRYNTATSSHERAGEYLRNARRSFQRAGALEREAEATLDYGQLCAATGDLKQAKWAAQTASALPLTSPERARVCTLHGELALLEDRLEPALKYLSQAKRLLAGDKRRRAQSRSAQAEILRSRCYRLLGRPRRAWASIRLAERLAAHAGERTLEVEVLVRRGRLLTEFGYLEQAELDLRDGLRLAQAINHRSSVARATLLLGILLAESDSAKGSKLLHQALTLAQQYKIPRLEALASTLCARVALARLPRVTGTSAADSNPPNEPNSTVPQELARAQALSERALYLIGTVGAELQDRIVALCTQAIVLRYKGQTPESRRFMIKAVRAWQDANARLQKPILKRRHHRANRSLVRAALTLEGPLYPRTDAQNLPGL